MTKSGHTCLVLLLVMLTKLMGIETKGYYPFITFIPCGKLICKIYELSVFGTVKFI